MTPDEPPQAVQPGMDTVLPAVRERSVLSSSRVKTPPAVPSLIGANPRRGSAGQALLSARTIGRTPHDSQLEQLKSQNAHLRDELQSLRDMYAKHTAYTELKCEKQLREKDQECVEWYKERQLDIQDMRAGVVVMHTLYQKKQQRLQAAMYSDKTQQAIKDGDLHGQVERLFQQREQDAARYQEELAAKTTAFEAEMATMRAQKAEVEDKAASLADQVAEARREIDRQKEQNRVKSQQLQEAKDKLVEAEKRADIDNRDGQIQSLEAELKATKKTMKEGWKKDVESLRRELMDYVRFIVHILPDNWCETEAADKVPQELKDQLLWMSGPKSASPAKGSGSSRGRKFLPPTTDILAKGAVGCSGQYAQAASAHP